MKEREGYPPAESEARPEKNSDEPRKRRPKTFWHYPYASLVRDRKPPDWDMIVEKILSYGPRWADLLLLRRKGSERRDGEARVLRGLWPHLTDVALLELKGPTSGLRKRDLDRLFSYGWEYTSQKDSAVEEASELSLVLAVPGQTRTLLREYERCKVAAEPMGGGYVRLHGTPFRLVVILMNEVADAEHDDFIRVFTDTRATIQDPDALRWMYTHVTIGATMEHLKHLEGFDDMIEQLISSVGAEKLLRHVSPEERLAGLEPEEVARHLSPRARLAGLEPEERLAGLEPEERLAGLEPEERLAGLEPEERLAGLEPEERLAGLEPEELVKALRSLPQGIQDAIRKKLDGS